MDIVFVIATVALFVICAWFAQGCDQVMGAKR
jgi:hypothetical protein